MVCSASVLQLTSVNCLTVFIIVCTIALSSSELSCLTRPPSCNCSSTTDGYELLCTAFTVKVKPLSVVHIKCSRNDVSDFSLLNGVHTGVVNMLIIDQCPLLSVPLSQLMKNMGMSNVNDVRFTYTGMNGSFAVPLAHELFRDLTNVTSLTLHTDAINSKKIFSLPTNMFVNMIKLQKIDLYGNEFLSLPQGLFSNNKELETVHIRDNRRTLNTLPNRFFANLIKLKEVMLQGSNMSTLPEDLLSGSKTLSTISLKNNTLIKLPEGLFKDCRELQTLDISFNRITYLPSELFYDTQSLEILKINNNQLTVIRNDLFSSMRNLRILDLKENRLMHIEAEAFDRLTSLKTLNMSNNQLTSVSFSESFKSYSKLEEMQLSNNSFTSILYDWQMLKTLKILNLTNNKISQIQAADLHFRSTENIFVYVCYNNISEIDVLDARTVYKYVPEIKRSYVPRRYFFIEGNPVNCDCKEYSLLQYHEDEITAKVELVVESKPGNLQCSKPEGYIKLLKENIPIKFFTCLLKNKYSLNCPEQCSCLLRSSDKTLLVDCHQSNLTSMPKALPDVAFSYYTELNLSGNNIKSVKVPLGPGYSKVTKYILSRNKISEIDLTAFSPELQVLEIEENRICRLKESSVEFLMSASKLKRLTLHMNPWKCDCKIRDFVNVIQFNYNWRKTMPSDKVTCENGKELLTLSFRELCSVTIVRKIETGSYVYIAVAIPGLILVMLLGLYFIFEREIKVWFILREDRSRVKCIQRIVVD